MTCFLTNLWRKKNHYNRTKLLKFGLRPSVRFANQLTYQWGIFPKQMGVGVVGGWGEGGRFVQN